ncbi:hypothetical protein GCK32_019141, partial [Trichostrongylus colubriformis]
NFGITTLHALNTIRFYPVHSLAAQKRVLHAYKIGKLSMKK